MLTNTIAASSIPSSTINLVEIFRFPNMLSSLLSLPQAASSLLGECGLLDLGVRRGLLRDTSEDRQLVDREDLVYVEQDHEFLVDLAHSGNELPPQLRPEGRRWLDVRIGDILDCAHRVYDHTEIVLFALLLGL